MNTSVNYNPSIKAVLKKVDLNLSLSKDSVALLNILLNGVNRKLIDFCQSKFQEGADLLAVAHNAVQTIFPGELKENAKAEGNKCIVLFYNGLLNYKLKGKASTSDPFSSGIRQLAGITFPQAKFDPETLVLLNYLLDNMCTKASEKAAETGLPKNKIDVRDFKLAFSSLLPKEILGYANYEGNKKILEHESGLFTFIPGAAVKKRKPKPPVKRKRISLKTTPKKDETTEKALKKRKVPKIPKVHLNYCSGIRHIAKLEHTKLRLTKPAVTLLNLIMNELNYKMISHFFTSTENYPENSVIGKDVAEDAVTDMFPGELLPHAYNEADKDIFMFQSGIMRFNPMGKKSKEKPKVAQKREFLQGIEGLTGLIFTGVTLHAKSKTFISQLLENFFTKIYGEAVAQMKNKNRLQHSDVELILQNVLGREMCMHASAGANLAVRKYEQGAFSFSPSSIKRAKK